MKKITAIIFVCFFIVQSNYSQNTSGISIGCGYIFSDAENTKLPYWENGYSIKFSVDYNIAQKINLFFSTSYQQHFFNSNLVSLVVPQVLGYMYSLDGENSSIIELSLGSKIYASNSLLKPYLGIGIGGIFINQGKVEITSWMDGNPSKSTNLYAGTGKNFSLFQSNFILGLEIGLYKNFQFVIEGKTIYGFNGPSYIPITASIKFGI